MLFGGLDREPAVQALPDPEVELARVAPLRQGFGNGLALRRQIGHGVGDQVNQPLQSGCLGVGEPRQREKFRATGDELAVFDPPRRAVGVAGRVGSLVLGHHVPHAVPKACNYLGVRLRLQRTPRAADQCVWVTSKVAAQFGYSSLEPSSGMRTLRAAHTRS